MLNQQIDRRVGNALHDFAVRAIGGGDEMRRQAGNVLFPLAQRRQGERKDRKIVIQIFAEFPLRDKLPQGFRRGGNHAHVSRRGHVFAQRTHGFAASRLRQPRLNFQRQIADLFQHERAAVHFAQQAEPMLIRAGKRAFAMAE